MNDIELDKSLTKSNFAADAKVVGDELKSRIKIEDVPVASVNGKTGKVQLTAADVGALPADTKIPSIEGLATESYVNTKIEAYATKEYVEQLITGAIGGSY